MSELQKRVLTALVAAPLAVGAVYLGGWALGAFVILLAGLAQLEVYGLAEAAGARPLRPLGLAVGALVAVRVLLPAAVPLAVLGLLALVVAELFRRLEQPIFNIAAGVLGVFYPAWLAGYVVELRERGAEALGETAGIWLLVTVFAAVWAADTFAYFAGRAFGRHPLFPRVSPKKTWEGAAGGLLGALALVALMKTLALPEMTWADVAALGIICGGISQLGDLAESLLKRSVGVKDSGRFLPGHGGVLDRLDAMLVAVPLAALYLEHVRGLF